jgi:hypothetical protein
LRFTFVLLLATTGAAAAQEMCGDPPIAPVIPSASEMRSKTPADAATSQHAAFADVRRWQGALRSYRDCLNATIATDKRQAEEVLRSDKQAKDQQSDIAKYNGEIAASNHAYDVSVDQEERVVNDFHAALVAYCTRKDVDTAICPK